MTNKQNKGIVSEAMLFPTNWKHLVDEGVAKAFNEYMGIEIASKIRLNTKLVSELPYIAVVKYILYTDCTGNIIKFYLDNNSDEDKIDYDKTEIENNINTTKESIEYIGEHLLNFIKTIIWIGEC